MKLYTKRLLLLFVPFLLISCGGSTNTWSDPDKDYPLEFDGYEGYEIPEGLTNQDSSVGYEIFVRSFYDHDGNGTGDLLGVKDKIPYLASLGVKTLWLLPIHKSPTYHGYDVTDYYSVNPDYGTLDDFDALVQTAGEYNIDIMLDMVFNHTSSSHVWFDQSFQDMKNNNQSATSKKDWYTWQEKSSSNYHRYSNTSYYYLGYFSNSMPDLNLDSTSLRDEIDNICKFWIQDHGVKGFRLDAILHYYETNAAKNNEFLGWLTNTTRKYNPNFYMVGEAWTGDSIINDHTSGGLDSCFRFGTSVMGDENLLNLAKGYGNMKSTMRILENNETSVKRGNPNAYSSYFVSNHDMDRPTFFDRDDALRGPRQAKALASMYLLLPGTPFIYYGEEITLVGTRTAKDTDVERRLPLIWSKTNKQGECAFPEPSKSYLMDNITQVELGVEDQLSDPTSLLNHYRAVINIRNKYPMFKHGKFTSLYSSIECTEDYMYGRIFAYKLSLNGEAIVIIHNLSAMNAEMTALGTEILDSLNVDDKAPTLKDGVLRLGAHSSVILKAE